MKNLLIIAIAFLFAACAQSTETNQTPEWDLGIYHGKFTLTATQKIPTVLKLRSAGKTLDGFRDSVRGIFYLDTTDYRDTVIHQIAGNKVVASTVNMYHGIQWAYSIYGNFATATPPNTGYIPTQIILNPTLDSAIVIDPFAWRDTTLKKE